MNDSSELASEGDSGASGSVRGRRSQKLYPAPFCGAGGQRRSPAEGDEGAEGPGGDDEESASMGLGVFR